MRVAPLTRMVPIALTAACLALPASAGAGAATITVEAGGANVFDPLTADYIVISSQFGWHWGTGGTTSRRHNVRQDSKLFYSGLPTKSYPSAYFVVSASAGTFLYHCDLYGGPGGKGMSGRIRVTPTYGSAGLTNDSISVKWADESNTTGDQYDVLYKVGAGRWKPWRANTASGFATFGRNDKPIDVKPGANYRFKARSEISSNTKRRSKWSPAFIVKTPV